MDLHESLAVCVDEEGQGPQVVSLLGSLVYYGFRVGEPIIAFRSSWVPASGHETRLQSRVSRDP